MVVLLFIVGVLAASAPIAAAVLVSVGSRCEDSAWTLGGSPPGPACAAARRMVAFHTRGIEWPRPDGRARARAHAPDFPDAWSPAPAEPSAWLLPVIR